MSRKDRISELENLGWERRTIIDEPRLSELVEMYKSLDLEVHQEPLTHDIIQLLGEDCDFCFSNKMDTYKIIFTRGLANIKETGEQ